MAYSVSENYRKVIYSGDNDNNLYVEYDGTEVENASLLATSLKWKRRVLANGSSTFSLDNFISQTIEFVISNYSVTDTSKEFYFKIGTLVNEKYEYVPLGYYHIKDSPTTVSGKTTYSLTDRSSWFDVYIDLSSYIEEQGGSITKLQAVQKYCELCGIELATTDFYGASDKIAIYDNTITARIHISYIAEDAGCIATIGRDGKLYFIPIVPANSSNTITIPEEILNNNMTNSKTTYKISKVLYEGALAPFEKGDEVNDTLFINTSNIYVSSQEEIDYIYNQIVGLEIDNISTSSVLGDPSIDPWDYITYTQTDDDGNEEQTFTSLGQYTLTFNGVFSQTFETTIDRENKKINSTVNSSSAKYRRIRQEIDNVEGTLKVISEKVVDISSTKSGLRTITLDNCYETFLYKLRIIGNDSLLYPSTNLYPSNELYLKNSLLYVNYGKTYMNTYNLQIPELRQYNGVYDEFVLENGKAKLIKRIKTNDDLSMELLDEPIETDLGEIYIELREGTNTLWIPSFESTFTLEATYLLNNDYTSVFANQAQVSNEIKIGSDEILIESKSYTDKATDGDELIASINTTSTGNVKIKASDTIALEGYTTINGNFSVDEEGNASMNSATITGGNIYLPEGGKIMGGDGILTTMTINSNIHSKSFVGGSALLPMGYSLNHEDSSGNIVSVKDCLVFEFTIPKNFTPISAYITLTHAPVKYYYCDSLNYTGYSRNLQLYKGSSLSNLYVKYEYGYYEVKPNGLSYSKVNGAFGSDGFTGSSSSLTSTTSTDLINYLDYSKKEDTYNVFKIETSNALVTSESDIYQQSGACNATLTIIGYTTN